MRVAQQAAERDATTKAAASQRGAPEDAQRAENWELCHACGGLCCALYLAHDECGQYTDAEWLPGYIEEWFEKFVASGALVPDGDGGFVAGAHGVEPLHDPLMSHASGPEGAAYRAALPDWIDVRKCQFCHPDTGCLLPGEYRAPICHEFHCELWVEK